MNVDNRAVYSRFFPRLLFFSLNRKFEIRGGGRKTRVRIGRRISNETREFSLHHSTALSPRFEMTNLAWRVPRVRVVVVSEKTEKGGERLGDKNTTTVEDFSRPRGAFPRNSIRANYSVRSSSVGFNHEPARPCNILLLCHLPKGREFEERERAPTKIPPL